MARRRFRRYSARMSSGSRLGAVIIAVIAFVLLCVAISVVIGIRLGKRADGVSDGNKPQYDLHYEPYASGEKTVDPVDAYAYAWGANANQYVNRGITDFSVMMKDPDGNLTYASEIGGLKDFCSPDERVDLAEELNYLHQRGGKVRGYFYVKSFDTEDKVLRELYQAYEVAQISEMARAGVDDLMLVGIAVSEENVEEVVHYVSEMALASEKMTLGVLVTPELVEKLEENVYHAARIRSVCDYLALDLRALPEDADEAPEEEGALTPLAALLRKMEYSIRSCGMRLVLSKENASLYDSVKDLGAESVQIIEE